MMEMVVQVGSEQQAEEASVTAEEGMEDGSAAAATAMVIAEETPLRNEFAAFALGKNSEPGTFERHCVRVLFRLLGSKAFVSM